MAKVIPEHKIPELTAQLARRILVAQFRLLPDNEIRNRYPGADCDPEFLRKLYVHFRVFEDLNSVPRNYMEEHYVPWFIQKNNLIPQIRIRETDISTVEDRSVYCTMLRTTIYGYRIHPGPTITEYKISFKYWEEDLENYKDLDFMPPIQEYPETQLSTFEFIAKYGFHAVELLSDDITQVVRSIR